MSRCFESPPGNLGPVIFGRLADAKTQTLPRCAVGLQRSDQFVISLYLAVQHHLLCVDNKQDGGFVS